MRKQITPKLDAIFIDDKSCCAALEILAEKHGLDPDHPYVQELQELMKINDCENFVVYLVNRVTPTTPD